MKADLIILAFVLLITISCEKGKLNTLSGSKVNFYLLKTFDVEQNTDNIVANTEVLSEEILIPYDGIISYNKNTFTFKVTEAVANEISSDNGARYHTKAFAITIDNEIIYTGYFWAAFSSRIVSWPVIENTGISIDNELRVELSYPGYLNGEFIEDKRNDKRLLMVFKNDNKLVD